MHGKRSHLVVLDNDRVVCIHAYARTHARTQECLQEPTNSLWLMYNSDLEQ